MSEDTEYMRAALGVARRGLGNVAPNPSVGCVLVKKGVIIGRGRTAASGRPHAEAEALAQAGAAAKNATAYVTLEPCAIAGRDGPCAGALVQAGVKRVVAGCIDPNPVVNGRGIEILREAGIEVVTGVLETECTALNRGFFLRITEKRPLVTLKMALTGDGMIAPASGKREWITGDMARRHVHLMRSQHDAILTAIGSVLNDDPLLTTRLGGFTHKPIRIILDSKLEMPINSQIMQSVDDAPVWIFHTERNPSQYEKLGARVFNVGRSPEAILKTLAAHGVTRVFFEGGGTVLQEFVKEGIGDRFLLYKNPALRWPGGRALNFPEIQAKLGLKLTETRVLGEDLLEIYEASA
ncbi:MAG: bifunctional diaminohydroxyphosphoribosylaminopyrimidine deaminase/5-amino-6-(5-phosphoribosylamino)uracil reductase RibD [Alphaproteobacteria bacterium]